MRRACRGFASRLVRYFCIYTEDILSNSPVYPNASQCFLMKELRHPNIVRLVGVCWDTFMVGLALEYVPNGTLEHWLRQDVIEKKKRKIAASSETNLESGKFLDDSSRR